jgi:Golgi SNAP receptor complex protein 2
MKFLCSNIQRLDILVNKELPVRRREARLKVDQLKQDRLMLQVCLFFIYLYLKIYKSILSPQNAIHLLQQKRMQREQEEAAREELLTQTFQPNNRETSLYIDQSLQHHTALNGIHRSLDDIWETGTAVLDGLRTQKSVFKKAHRRLLDVTSMLSLSNSVMRMIERRSTQDKYLFYGLAIITCIFILVAFWYFRQ